MTFLIAAKVPIAIQRNQLDVGNGTCFISQIRAAQAQHAHSMCCMCRLCRTGGRGAERRGGGNTIWSIVNTHILLNNQLLFMNDRKLAKHAYSNAGSAPTIFSHLHILVLHTAFHAKALPLQIWFKFEWRENLSRAYFDHFFSPNTPAVQYLQFIIQSFNW